MDEPPSTQRSAEELQISDLRSPISDFQFPISDLHFAICNLQFAICNQQFNAPLPRIVSLSLPRQKPQVASYTFSFNRDPQGSAPPASREPSRSPIGSRLNDSRTRIKPPADIVKLQDRLLYLLQPPLEAWLSSGELALPFRPFPYQLGGVAFLYPRYSAILADEMGLGKTMQAITAMRLLLHRGEIRTALLVCPKPLVTNWRREFEAWAPELPVTIIEGDQNRRHWQWEQASSPVTIANYEVLVRGRDLVTAPGLHFDLVVLDEAQRIKNRASATAEVACSLARSRNWALTGTPIENSVDDLVGIFDFLAPGHLSKHMKPRAIRRAVSDHVLRRTKRQVLSDLPPLLVRDAELTLTPAQQASYDLAENDGVVRLESLGTEITIQHVFELVLRLKQICNFDPATGESAKLERLTADLDEVVASGQKAIVFSQWVQTLSRLADHLRPLGVLEYHGQIAPRQRDAVLARFRDEPRKHVLLMSYGAGAVGLNLQFASYVFLFDRWWNPAVEDQAINRAHRIGAAGPVTVTRFMTLATIEQRIEQILREKRELFEMILSEAEPKNLGLSQAEIFGLFRLKAPATTLRAAA